MRCVKARGKQGRERVRLCHLLLEAGVDLVRVDEELEVVGLLRHLLCRQTGRAGVISQLTLAPRFLLIAFSESCRQQDLLRVSLFLQDRKVFRQRSGVETYWRTATRARTL